MLNGKSYFITKLNFIGYFFHFAVFIIISSIYPSKRNARHSLKGQLRLTQVLEQKFYFSLKNESKYFLRPICWILHR